MTTAEKVIKTKVGLLELGKQLASGIEKVLAGEADAGDYDASTQSLVKLALGA